jgi:hypothetical protein
MSIQYYPNGVGGDPPGDFLDTCLPLYTSGNVWYVSSLTGTDAISPAGLNREKPLATLSQALSNALAGDIVVFLPGHTQTITGVHNISKRLTLLGEGVANGKPSVSFKPNFNGTMFNPTADGVEFRNLYFPESVQANASSKIGPNNNVAEMLVRGCYFEQGPNDLGPGLSITGARCRVESSTFISTATLTTAQPYVAIQGGGTVASFTMIDTVVSAGTVGFSLYSAIDFTLATVTNLNIESLSLLLGADMALPVGATGRVNIQTATGGSRVQWS